MDEQSEKDNNLREILGFDPGGDSAEAVSAQGSSRRPERRDWPENWRENFRRSVALDVGKDPDLLLHVDEDELFVIRKNYVDKQRIERSYYKLAHGKNEFMNATRFSFYDGDEDDLAIDLATEMNNEFSVGLELVGGVVNTFKSTDGRSVDVRYEHDGTLLETEFGVSKRNSQYGENELRDYKQLGLSRISQNDEGAWVSEGDLDMEIDSSEDELIKIRRMEGDEIIDEIEVPTKINIREIFDKWIPEELKANPISPNVKLDLGWRGRDFFNDVGIKWDQISDDSFNSLVSVHDPMEVNSNFLKTEKLYV